MYQRIQCQPAIQPGGVVAEAVGGPGVSELMNGEGDDQGDGGGDEGRQVPTEHDGGIISPGLCGPASGRGILRLAGPGERLPALRASDGGCGADAQTASMRWDRLAGGPLGGGQSPAMPAPRAPPLAAPAPAR